MSDFKPIDENTPKDRNILVLVRDFPRQYAVVARWARAGGYVHGEYAWRRVEHQGIPGATVSPPPVEWVGIPAS